MSWPAPMLCSPRSWLFHCMRTAVDGAAGPPLGFLCQRFLRLMESVARLTLLPKRLRHCERCNTDRLPPPKLFGRPMRLAMMRAAQRHCVLIADLPPERARLGKRQMMRVRGLLGANQTRLRAHKSEM